MEESIKKRGAMQFSLRTVLELVVVVAVVLALFRPQPKNTTGRYQITSSGGLDTNGNPHIYYVLLDTESGQSYYRGFSGRKAWQKFSPPP